MSKLIDETGHRYGRLTVIRREGKSSQGLATWLCKCDCGKECVVPGAWLRTGNTKSCGCLNKSQLFNGSTPSIKIGDKFGKLTIIKELGLRPYGNSGKNRRWYLCECECGNIVEKLGNSLKTGNTQSCGCLTSKGELKVEQILKEYNIIYKKEYVDELLVQEYNRRFRFDFAIYNEMGELLRYIEFDGKQHKYGMDKGIWSKTIDLTEIQERDKLKNNFCKEHNITLIRIPYYKINSLTLQDLMGDKYKI